MKKVIESANHLMKKRNMGDKQDNLNEILSILQ
jgi:hypothetical protein